jgi:hypothetical protein
MKQSKQQSNNQRQQETTRANKNKRQALEKTLRGSKTN